VYIDDLARGSGSGSAKKYAEQDAAAAAHEAILAGES
jgi:dsRNA-specific ribonuclease